MFLASLMKIIFQTYFGLAIDNVKNNLGSNCVTEDHVREVCRTMLDEAKLMYSNPPLSGSNSPFNTAQTTDTLIESRFAKQHSKVNIKNMMCMAQSLPTYKL